MAQSHIQVNPPRKVSGFVSATRRKACMQAWRIIEEGWAMHLGGPGQPAQRDGLRNAFRG